MAAALQLLQLHTVLAEPFAVGMRLCQPLLDLTIVVYLAFLCVDEQDLPWLQAPFAHHTGWFKVHHAHL